MRFFIKHVLLVFVIVLILCLTSKTVATYQPPQDYLSMVGLSRCGSEVCVIGIRPGKTSWADAKSTLLSLAESVQSGDEDITITRDNIKSYFWKEIRGSNTLVALTAAKTTSLLNVGQLIGNLGTPCSLTITENAVYLEYPQLIAHIPLDGWNPKAFLNPELPIVALYFGQPMACKQPLTFPSARNISVRWCGFASVTEYLARCRT
jgi:hypothetical protein